MINYGAGALFLAGTYVALQDAEKSGAEESDAYFENGMQALHDAHAVRQAGQMSAFKSRRAGRSVISAARSGFGASGVDVNSGSAERVQQTIATSSETDALEQILYGERRAEKLEWEGEQSFTAAQTAINRANRKGLGSLLGGGGAVASGWK